MENDEMVYESPVEETSVPIQNAVSVDEAFSYAENGPVLRRSNVLIESCLRID